MAASGSQLTRIGAFFSGIAKKLTITPKAESEIILGVGVGFSTTLTNDGIAKIGLMYNDGIGAVGLMANDGIGKGSRITNDGIGKVGLITNDGIGETGEI